MKGSEALFDMFTLRSRVALITGSAGGLGWGMAQAAAQAGAHVVLSDISAAALDARVEEIRAAGLDASAVAFDVTDESAVAAAIAGIIQRLGRIDILVNNAGIQNRKPFPDYSLEEWKVIVDTHLHGTFLTTRTVVPQMIANRHGRIIMIGSIAAQSVKGTIAPYAAAKGALTSLVRALAMELGPQGITCNGIAPGYFATDFTKALHDDDAFNSYVASRVPLGRWGRPEDLAPAVIYLASAAGAFVNGNILTIDGGVLAAA